MPTRAATCMCLQQAAYTGGVLQTVQVKQVVSFQATDRRRNSGN